MKQYPFPKSRFWSAVFGLVLFALLLLTRDTLISSLRLGFYPSQFAMLAVMVLTGLTFLTVNRHHLREIFTDRRMGAHGNPSWACICSSCFSSGTGR